MVAAGGTADMIGRRQARGVGRHRGPARGVDGADLLVDAADGDRELGELGRGHRLVAVREGLDGSRVDLDEKPVGACGRAGEGERRDEPALPGRVRRVDPDRQVGQLVDERHGGHVERVAVGRLEGPDAALAEDHVRVAARHDVLGRHQPLLDRAREASLEEHRPSDPPDGHQERVVLHVPGADLEDVGVLGDVLHLARLHHLGDDRQARPLARLGEEAEPLEPEPLERVGAGPRLEGAAAQDVRADRL